METSSAPWMKHTCQKWLDVEVEANVHGWRDGCLKCVPEMAEILDLQVGKLELKCKEEKKTAP